MTTTTTTTARTRQDVLDRLNAVGQFELPRHVRFSPHNDDRGFQLSVKLTAHRDRLLRIDLAIYGRMVYRSDEGSAFVNITVQGPDSTPQAWTDAKRWQGPRFADMPDGARRAVADAVLRTVGAVDWSALAAEEVVRERRQEIERLRGDASDLLTKAAELGASDPVIPAWRPLTAE